MRKHMHWLVDLDLQISSNGRKNADYYPTIAANASIHEFQSLMDSIIMIGDRAP
jgi:hypothetical protein